jgi:hypothetical protein
MDVQSLIDYGFKEYKDNLSKADRHFGYTVRDDNGRVLTAHVRFWRHSKYDGGRDSFDAWCQYNRTSKTFNVDLFVRQEDTPASVVEWFKLLWERMACDYYKRYEKGANQ